MNVCIVGDGLVSLTLANVLINEGIKVDILTSKKLNKIDKSRTIGISKSNFDYFNKNILDIKKLSWKIKKIEIYSDNLKNEKILNFKSNKGQIFSMIKNYDLHEILSKRLKKNNLFKHKKNNHTLSNKNYNLVINCDKNSYFSKKFFYKEFVKNYKSYAHTTVFKHKKLLNNDTAIQIFTNKGPLAFLPISDQKTSVVYSARGSQNINFENLIRKYNTKYSILKINKKSTFELKASNLRNYKHKNILAFGDLLHKLHPLAGQGFNMSLRDIKVLMDLIKTRLNLGLEIDSSVCINFEKKIKYKNYLFSNGIDFIYEFFNFESRIENPILSKSVQFLGKNNYTKSLLAKIADNGVLI